MTKKLNSPYTVTIIDCLDAYHHADVFDDDKYAVVGKNYSDLGMCMALADRLFYALNPLVKSQAEWTEWEDGHDVRVYDADLNCVYKAHDKLPKETLEA